MYPNTEFQNEGKIELQREIQRFTVIVDVSHITFTITATISKQKVKKNIKDFYNTIKLDLIDI